MFENLQHALLCKKLESETRRRKEAERERARLERKIIEVVREERQRFGSELHDRLGHDLLEISMKLGVLGDTLDDSQRKEKELVREIANRVRQAIKKSRSVVQGVFPVILENATFADIVDEFKHELETNHSIELKIETNTLADIERAKISRHMYYIIKEAVANIVKHSRANTAWISIVDDLDAYIVSIRDDGIGLPKFSRNPDCMGMRIMKHRASMIGAELDIISEKDSGTEIRCKSPSL